MANKKNSKGKGTKVARPRKATSYELTGKDMGELNGQQKIIHNELSKLGSATTAELANRVANRLETKQDPKRVTGFYMQAWKADGYVRKSKESKAAA